MADIVPDDSALLPAGRLSSREGFRETVRRALAAAAREGWPEIVLCDSDFHDWPLGDAGVIDSLHAWAKGGRHLTVMAGTFDEMVRRHARFVRWRQTWDHVVTGRRITSKPVDIPSVLWSPQWSMHRIDPVYCTYVASGAPSQCAALREMLQEWRSAKSVPGFSATTLGL